MAEKKISSGSGPGGLPWPELASDQPAPVYGVFGEEDFLVGQALDAIAASPAFAINPSLNIERFSAQQDRPSKVLESALTMPFLGPRRLVVVQELEQYKAEQSAEFLDYLEDPPGFTCLVFAGSKLDSRTRFGKTLQKKAKVHVFKKLYANQLPPWLDQRAGARGKRLQPEARARLAELGGLGLGALDSELEKLSLYVGKRELISDEDVSAVVGSGRLSTIFDFTDALAAAQLHRALTSFDRLYSLGEPPVRALAMVQRLFRQLLQVREIIEQRGGEAEVQRALHIPAQAARTLVWRARQEGSWQLAGRLSRLLEADLALKSSPGSDRVIMERLIMELCEPPGR